LPSRSPKPPFRYRPRPAISTDPSRGPLLADSRRVSRETEAAACHPSLTLRPHSGSLWPFDSQGPRAAFSRLQWAGCAVNPHGGTCWVNGVALLRGRRSSLMSIVVGEPAVREGLHDLRHGERSSLGATSTSGHEPVASMPSRVPTGRRAGIDSGGVDISSRAAGAAMSFRCGGTRLVGQLGCGALRATPFRVASAAMLVSILMSHEVHTGPSAHVSPSEMCWF
jgi:hypothetical protein